MSNKVTIHTVAEACNVSSTTVSLVLNDKPGISQETREMVLEAARSLGYIPNSISRRHIKQHLSTVGMVVKTEPGLIPLSNPFYSQIIVGVDDTCRDMGISLLFGMLPVNRHNQPVDMPPLLENSRVDGLLMVGTFIDETVYAIVGDRQLPIVLVDGYSETNSYDMVVSDNYRASYLAVAHLIQSGHRHIGLIGGESNCYPSISERRKGYHGALRDHGIENQYTADFNIYRTQGETETALLLASNPQVSAIFCVNDNVALGAMRAAQKLNKRIPEHLSIIGYDDTYLASTVSPRLSTVHVDTQAMGRAAVHLLSMRLEKPGAARLTVTIHSDMIERESTAKR
ncbi:MAG: LacI family DNA-binding transcriptional regulator [Candidatus Promineifilaceae bacterium]